MRTSNNESNGFKPATARTRSPTAPGAFVSDDGSVSAIVSETSRRTETGRSRGRLERLQRGFAAAQRSRRVGRLIWSA